MTFEEKLAAKGRKMDEAKAKLDDAINARKLEHQKNREQIAADIAKLDAALDELDAAIDDQIDKQYATLDAQLGKQCDTLDAQIIKQCDTMERRADKLDAQIDKQLDTMEERAEKLEAKLEERAAKAKAAFTLDKATAEAVANEPTGIDEIQKGTAEQIARAKGDVATAEENARLVQEYRDSKRNSVKLRTQMKVNNAKEKIAARKEAIDKAEQEEWILDLLDYAEGCYEMAYAWALEAEYTMMEAAYEMDYYNERFGKEE